MEASGANNSEYCICSSMTRSSHWIFKKSSQPAFKDIFTEIFQLIQLRNLGTKYWVYGVARKLGFGENSVWSSTPRLGEGLSNMLEVWIEGAARTEDPKRTRIDGEAWDEARGGGLGRGLGEPLPRKILKIHTWNHAFWSIVEAKI